MDLMKKYDINPKIREIIEKQQAKKGIIKTSNDISNVEAENIIYSSFLGKYPSIKEYNDKSKKRLLHLIYDIDINDYKKDELLNFYNYIKNVFNDNELDGIIKHYITKYYKPGYVFSGLKTYHKNIIYLMTLFNIEVYNGIIINTSFIGDMIKIFPDINFDDKGIITDDTTNMVSNFINDIKNNVPNIKISINDNIIAFAINDNDHHILIEKFNGMEVDLIPVHFFKWE